MNVYVSVGVYNAQQEEFVRNVEERLRAEGLVPQTVGRNVFTADSPFLAVNELMDKCRGVVIIALERLHIESGVEKGGGPGEVPLRSVKICTPWNHIEASLGYARRLPLLVIVQEGVRADGFLERTLGRNVQTVTLDKASLNSPSFNGVLASWKEKLAAPPSAARPADTSLDVEKLTIGELLGKLKPAHLRATVGGAVAALAGAFALGAKLFP
jgi:hypothetical protein